MTQKLLPENHQSAAVESGEEFSIWSVRAIYLAGKLCGLSWHKEIFCVSMEEVSGADVYCCEIKC